MTKPEIHANLCKQITELYARKNADYGDSFARLRKRYPNFICMRLYDKLNRLDTIIQPGHELQVTDEKIEDTLMDIANYALMEITERRAAQGENTEKTENPIKDFKAHGIGHMKSLLNQVLYVGNIGCEGIDCLKCPFCQEGDCAFIRISSVIRKELERVCPELR